MTSAGSRARSDDMDVSQFAYAHAWLHTRRHSSRVGSARAGARAGLGLPRVLPTPGVVDATNTVA